MLRNALSTGGLSPLTGYPQFILTDIVEREGQRIKVPLDYRTMEVTDAHHPGVWLDVESALCLSEATGKYVGFVLTKADPFYFLDIDNCREKSGEWSALANSLKTQLPGAAVEVSQSGNGLHMFGRTGEFEHACKNVKLGIELYTEGRFVQLTGTDVEGTAATDSTTDLFALAGKYFPARTLADGQGWTESPLEAYGTEIADKDVLAAALKAKSAGSRFTGGIVFKDIWEADADKLTLAYPSPTGNSYDASAADMAAASHLMFFTGGNCKQVERLMRASKLARGKWDTHPTYLKGFTVTRARQMWEGSGSKCYTVPARLRKPAPEETAKPDSNGDGLKIGAGFQHYHLRFPGQKSNSKPKGTYENFEFMADHFDLQARYNVMSKECDFSVPGNRFVMDNERNNMLSVLTSLCVQLDYPTDNIERYVSLYASNRIYHPVREWVESKPWDGQDRLPALLDSLDPVNHQIAGMLLPKWLVTCVMAAYNPEGVDAAGILVLQGEQNIGKTRWFLSLADFNETWAKQGAILNPNDRDSVKQVVSYWLVELGELDATFRRSDISALKGFLTKKYDEFRAPYARAESKFPRRTVFFASVNPREYLFDESGNRRYWTIEIGNRINANHGLDMQQVWSQIKALWGSRTITHWLNQQECALLNDVNDNFEASTVELDLIRSRYDMDGERTRQLTTSEILIELGMDPSRSATRKASPRIAKALKVKGTRKSNGRKIFDMPALRGRTP